MALTGKQKAAMLLMSLDATTAAELLKGVDPQTIQELAVEVAYLNVAGPSMTSRSTQIARQFCLSLGEPEGFQIKDFLGTMLKSTVGQEEADRIQNQIDELLQQRDPFIPIRLAEAKTLAPILNKEHPQVISVVLSELPPRKSSEVMALLGEEIRSDVVTRMTGGQVINPEAKARIAQLVCSQLQTPKEASESPQEENHAMRKVAIMLRNLGQEIREGLLDSISKKDKKTGEMVTELMVLWEDIIDVTDRSLQDALRSIDSQKLAMGLFEADETIGNKIKSNISERAAEAIEEEMSLMSKPSKEDIEEAQNDIVKVLREMNAAGELNFVEEE